MNDVIILCFLVIKWFSVSLFIFNMFVVALALCKSYFYFVNYLPCKKCRSSQLICETVIVCIVMSRIVLLLYHRHMAKNKPHLRFWSEAMVLHVSVLSVWRRGSASQNCYSHVFRRTSFRLRTSAEAKCCFSQLETCESLTFIELSDNCWPTAHCKVFECKYFGR